MGYLPEDWIQKKEIELAEKQAGANDTNQDVQAIQLQQETANLVKEQLDLSEELDLIEHLLRGHVLKYVNIEGAEIQRWVEPTDPDSIILTEYGVQLIMNTITFYLNKNTLLSNYDNETIFQCMKDFAHALNRAIFLKLEKVFVQPTFEECKGKFNAKIKKKTELRRFVYETLGKEVNEKQIEKEFLKEYEETIEKELEKIRITAVEEKIKQYELLITKVRHSVHSTYLRAFNGIERRTLREHIHTTESLGQAMPQMRQPRSSSGGGFSPMKLFRRG